MSSESGKTIQAVDTALAFLDSIATMDEPTITDLVETSSLSRSSVHHYLCSLERAGYITRENGTLSLGEQLLRLGGQYRRELFWFPTVQKQSVELAREVQATVSVDIVREETVMTIFTIHGEEYTQHPAMGFEQPIGDSAAGYAFDIARDEDSERPPELTVDDSIVVAGATNAVDDSQERPPEQVNGRVRIARAICPADEPVAVVNLWVSQGTWSDTEDDLKESLNTAVGIMEVNVTYSDW
jgi:hypothetical protein